MPNPALDHAQELSSINFASMLGGPLIACVEAQTQAAMSAVNFIREVGFKKIPDDLNPNATQIGEPVYVSFKYPKEVAPYQPPGPGTLTVTITEKGSGYKDRPKITISGGGGTGAIVEGIVDADGKVTSANIISPGSGYSGTPNATVDDPPSGTNTVQAKATATFVPGPGAVPAQIQMMAIEVPILAMVPIPYLRIEDVTIDFNVKIDSMEYQKVDTSLAVGVDLAWYKYSQNALTKLKVSASYQRNTQQGTSVARTYSMAVHIKAVQDEIPKGMEKILDILETCINAQPVGIPAPVTTTT
jgi:hypothetical protein